MKKRFFALVAALAMLLCALPTMAYSVKDAYEEFRTNYPDFVESIKDDEVDDELITQFLAAIQRTLYRSNRSEPITEENFESRFINAVITLSSTEAYLPIQNSLARVYPDASYEAFVNRTIADEFQPLCDTVKSMVFEHNMLEEIDTGDDEEEDTTVKIVTIREISAITLTEGETLSLPETTEATLEDESTLTLNIEWKTIPSVDTAGTYTAEGVAIIPGSCELSGSLSNILTAEITVNAKETSNTTDNNNSGTTDNNSGTTDNNNTGTTDNNNSGTTDNNNSGTTDNSGSSSGSNTSGSSGNTGTTAKLPTDNTTKTDTDSTTTTTTVHKYTFTDVNESTSLGKAVYALTDLGVINGYLDGTFKPANNITRAEFAKIVVTALDAYSYDAKADFTDVPAEQWYYSFVASAKNSGLINGYPDGSFAPEANITRAEAMTIIYRALDAKKVLKTVETSTTLADASEVPDFAKTAISALVDNGVVAADANGKINAAAAAGRGDCAEMLYNALKLVGTIK